MILDACGRDGFLLSCVREDVVGSGDGEGGDAEDGAKLRGLGKDDKAERLDGGRGVEVELQGGVSQVAGVADVGEGADNAGVVQGMAAVFAGADLGGLGRGDEGGEELGGLGGMGWGG